MQLITPLTRTTSWNLSNALATTSRPGGAVARPSSEPKPCTRSSVLVLRFHGAQAGERCKPPAVIDTQFARLADHFPCVLPGDPLDSGVNLCLSFDGAYYDFYQTVFPLLEKHRLRALLAVPAGLIADRSTHHPFFRTHLPDRGMNPHEVSEGRCTWPELRELAATGRVTFAATGMNQTRLDRPETDLAGEICGSGLLLAEKLQVAVESFVFPAGRFSPSALKIAQAHYRHVFGLGGAINPGWQAPVLYRVDGDAMDFDPARLTPGRLRTYRAQAWLNRFCCR